MSTKNIASKKEPRSNALANKQPLLEVEPVFEPLKSFENDQWDFANVDFNYRNIIVSVLKNFSL